MKEESTECRARNVEPVLGKFVPLKKNCNEDEESEDKESKNETQSKEIKMKQKKQKILAMDLSKRLRVKKEG